MTAFFTGPSIAWGPGAVEQLSGLGARRAYLLLDAAVAQAPAVRRVGEELEKVGAAVEVGAREATPDRLDAVRRTAESLRRHGPDLIVAVGGGRTIDAAKAARLLFESPELSLAEPPPLLPFPERSVSRFVAVPTTSGSGAEASWTADLWDDDGRPLEIADRRLVPEWALVDPGFAERVPVDEVVPLALEALALAVEAYLSAWSNPFSDALALAAVGTIVRRLPHAVRWSGDPEARSALHYAATGAGLAASNAQRGLAHALARALQPATGLSYARAIGVVLPAVLDFVRPAARDRLEELARAAAPPEERAVVALSVRLRRLAETLKMPTDLRSAGVDPERLDQDRGAIVARTLGSPATLANPRVPTPKDVEELLRTVAGPGAPPRG